MIEKVVHRRDVFAQLPTEFTNLPLISPQSDSLG